MRSRENEDQMTDAMPEQTAAPEDWSDVEQSADGATYPEAPDNPHNHRFTISFDGRGPMVVVRGNTAEDVIAAYQELENHAVGAAMGNAWAALKASAAIANGLGATAVPAGAPALPQASGTPTPPPFGPNVSVPQAPGFQGNPGFPPAMQAPPAPPVVQSNTPEYQQAGWYRLTVPFKPQGSNPGKPAFDGICAQYQLRKGRPTEGGQLSFNKADKSWYVSPEVAGAFPQFSPVPA
jgi:hypothetical protein